MPRRLSILAVTSEPPWPLDSGGRLRTYHLLRRLARDHDVRLVTPGRDDGPAAAPLREAAIVPIFAAGTRHDPISHAVKALGSVARARPYVMYERHDHPAVRAAVRAAHAARPADVLYLDHLDSFVYAGEASGATTVGDLHNVYSLLVERTADDDKRALVRRYLRREARLLAAEERRAAGVADLLTTVSEREAGHFRSIGTAAVEVVPNGIDCARYADLPVGRPSGPPVVMFLGAMSWEPNVAAAELLAERVLPALADRIPDVRLRIVGRDPSPRVQRLAASDRVEVTGAVPDVHPHLAEAHVLAVPLQAGGGTRLKILEAFAAGLPVVSTAVGVEGIDATADRHLVVAEIDGFADAIARLLSAPGFGAELAGAARTLVEARYDWNAIGTRASEFIQQAHARRGKTPDAGATASARAERPAPTA